MILNFSSSVLFHMKTRVCLKYFVNDCKNFGAMVGNEILQLLSMKADQLGDTLTSMKIMTR